MAEKDKEKFVLNVTIRTRVVLGGYPLDIESAPVDINYLQAFAAKLRKQNAEPIREPVVFEVTPDGAPICPKHRVPMRQREKQGDTWHSHKVTNPHTGEELWCKGYAGADSPGFDVEARP